MGKKKCKDGKNCGATCINRGKKCLLDLGESLSADLSSASTYIKNSSLQDLPIPETPVTAGGLSVAGAKFMAPYRDRLRLLKETQERAFFLLRPLTEKYIKESDEGKKKEIRDKMMKVIGVESRASVKRRALMQEIRDKLLKTNLSAGEVKDIANKISIKGDDLGKQSRVRDIIEEFVRLFNGRGVIEKGDEGSPSPVAKTVEIGRSKRAFADPSNNLVYTDGESRTTFHELGHFVEYQSKRLYNYAERWRDSKALTATQILSSSRDEPLYTKGGYSYKGALDWMYESASTPRLPIHRLNKLTNTPYDDEEIGLMGKYMSPYMGKVYQGRSTEIISIALESFSSASSMGKLYDNHPDLFNTVVGLAVTPF